MTTSENSSENPWLTKAIQGLSDPGDPIATFLADPESHLSDILYLNFRIYKKRLLWRFFQTAIAQLEPLAGRQLALADIGASMAFDVVFLLRSWTDNHRLPLPCTNVHLSLVEGDQGYIDRGTENLRRCLPPGTATFEFYSHPFVEGIPLPDASQEIVICSEVVEHLREPEKLIAEMHRILQPGGFCLLTTDNSPNLLQRLRRIPVWLKGEYRTRYAPPDPATEIYAHTQWRGKEYPIYGHISLHPTRHWERLGREAGFELADFGTYESIRRGGASRQPFVQAIYAGLAAVNYHLLPRRLARFIGDTTALLWRKPRSGKS